MFRYFTALLLLAAFGAQTFEKAVIVLDYYANTASFAKNCENKAIPKMHCNGKCQMMKKLKEEEKKERQNPERKSENKNQTISSRSFFATLSLHTPAFLPAGTSQYAPTHPIDRAYAIFHPPTLV
jgi:hypothetical protein